MADKRLTIALAGNPNSGKTTIFNRITGTRQKVGNWPGVTVEKKEGTIHRHDHEIRVVDLPGTYSLTPFSIEEIVARDFILESAPDLVIDIIDASNLERSLYLATQLRELDCRVLFVLNMADLARERGIKIDGDKLSELLDLPVVFTVGNRGQGIDDLLRSAIDLADRPLDAQRRRRVRYSKDIEAAIAELGTFLREQLAERLPYNPRWTAIKLLEDDQVVRDRVAAAADADAPDLLDRVSAHRDRLREIFNDDPEIVMTDERYGFIAGIVKEVVTLSTRKRADISRSIDLVLTNRFIGFPIFIFFIWAMFQLTFTLGTYPMAAIEAGVSLLDRGLTAVLPAGIIRDFLLDGVLAGVGSVIIFLPNILILFFCIAIFEDTGYMARAAFLMDRIMHLIGLHGKSFIPMLMGFGCNVPAIVAARTLESEKDRILTILITPFMSCSARLPVYIILAGTFFGARAGTAIFAVYILGIVLAVVSGRIFRSTLLKGGDAPFVMELPPYRVPMAKSLLIHMWDRSRMFLRKMGGVILVGSVVVWVLSAFPRELPNEADRLAEMSRIRQAAEVEMATAETPSQRAEVAEQSAAAVDQLRRDMEAERVARSPMGRIGQAMEPVFAPIGIDWRGGVALLTGFVAKEIVVSTMGVLYAAEEGKGGLSKALAGSTMTPLSAMAMMVFVLLYVPCLATVETIRRETGSVRWMIFNIVYSTLLAWVLAFAVYQGGRLLGFS